jgi:hypothetical protein
MTGCAPALLAVMLLSDFSLFPKFRQVPFLNIARRAAQFWNRRPLYGIQLDSNSMSLIAANKHWRSS